MFCTRKSIRNLVKRYLGLQADICLHQTLTFREVVVDRAFAKRCLKKWLDNIHARFEFASLWVEQRQRRGAIHFHVLLFPFQGDDPLNETEIRAAGFKAWQKAAGGTLSRKGNLLRVHPKDESPLEYVLREVQPFEDFPAESVTSRWWGFRKTVLARKHWVAPSKRKVSDFVSRMLDDKTSANVVANFPARVSRPAYGWGSLRREKRDIEAWLEARGRGPDWEEFKTAQAGLKRKVSNQEFISFRNGATLSESGVVPDECDPFSGKI